MSENVGADGSVNGGEREMNWRPSHRRSFGSEQFRTLPVSAELAALPPFSHLDPTELRLLAARGSWLNVAPGEVLMTQGEAGDAFYVIESGQLDVIEDRVTVRTCGPGDYVGEIALLFDTPRTATVQTTTSAHLYRLDRDGFTTFVAARFRRGTLRTNVLVERDWNH